MIERLTRKYGGGSRDVLEHGRRLVEELLELETADDRREEVERQAAACLAEYRARAETLSRTRRELGAALRKDVLRHLRDLALERGRLRRRDRPGAAPRQPPGDGRRAGGVRPPGLRPGDLPLQRQPGGSASSAVQGRLRRRTGAPVPGASDCRSRRRARQPDRLSSSTRWTQGLGGAEAAIVGGKLKGLARGGQILAVTHLPQVASRGDRHLEVRKEVRAGRTRVDVHRLDDERRVEEVARMLAGEEITETARSAAEELLAGASVD